MPKARHYSPQIRRDLITKLYHQARAEKIPMTKLTNRLLDEAMKPASEEPSCRVAESPPKSPAAQPVK